MRHAEEFEHFIEPHLQTLHHHCLYLTPSEWDAEDLVQEVLIKAYQYYLKAGAIRHPSTLLYKMTRNIWIDGLRRHRRTVVSVHAEADLPYSDANYAAARGLVEWLAEHLSEREAYMLLLSEVFSYSYQNIADELQCTVATVRMVLHRSKRTLRITRDARRNRPAGKRMSEYSVEYWTKAIMNDEPGRIMQFV
ncbi:RNA polymerase sigma factor [Paenibacillus oenotherae]|uniref:RNA polymerase sigma factor n=1 Tax=Paenibacillus oenotherae TaxID=1435645 RepID=A0ABS7D3R3_9BACL|nr:RNA polymerase sigma factor [Paenibacillus oenotherae]MBW7473813.1 RNA polymerase sigma factor [Paenibacillus oenotherae]